MAEVPRFSFGHAVSAALLVAAAVVAAGELAGLCHYVSVMVETGPVWALLVVLSVASFLVSILFAMRNSVMSMSEETSATGELEMVLQQMGFFSLGFVTLILAVAAFVFNASPLIGACVAGVVVVLWGFKRGLEEIGNSSTE